MKKAVSIILALLLILVTVAADAEDIVLGDPPGEDAELERLDSVLADPPGEDDDPEDPDGIMGDPPGPPEDDGDPGESGSDPVEGDDPAGGDDDPGEPDPDDEDVNYAVYTVYYLEQGTDRELAPSKTVEDKALGDAIVEDAEDVKGYVAISPARIEKNLGEEDREIVFYYERDMEQKQNVWYKVIHVVDGEHQPEYDVTVTGTAWQYDPNPTLTVTAASLAILEFNGFPFGYCDSPGEVGEEVEHGTVITLYYYDMLFPEISYQVRYYYDGVMSAANRLIFAENVILGEEISIYPNMSRAGYRLSHTRNFPLTISIDNRENIIHVYYESIPAPTRLEAYDEMEIPLSAGLGSLNVGDCAD